MKLGLTQFFFQVVSRPLFSTPKVAHKFSLVFLRVFLPKFLQEFCGFSNSSSAQSLRFLIFLLTFPQGLSPFPLTLEVFHGFLSLQVCTIHRVEQENEHSFSLLEKLARGLCCSNQTTNCKIETILPTPWFLASSR